MATKPAAAPDEAVTTPLDEPQDTAEPTADELKAQLREEKTRREAAEALAEERKVTREFIERREREGRPLRQQKPPPAADPDPLDDLDLLTLLTEEKDPARIKQVFAKAVKSQIATEMKRGNYVSREEAESYVANMIGAATEINRLVADFPQLSDPKSEFFAETQKQLGALANDPTYYGAPDNVLQRLAAQQAKLTLLEAGKLNTESSDDRYERIANQRGGSRGRGQASSEVGLSSAEKDMARKLGVAEKDYLAQKKALLQPGALGPAMTADRMMREYNG